MESGNLFFMDGCLIQINFLTAIKLEKARNFRIFYHGHQL